MPGKHQNTPQLEPAALAAALAAATTKARSLRRRLKAPAADEDDFRQAILLDLIHRADRFDPDRAVWGAFVSMVMQHTACGIAQRHLRHAGSVTELSPDHEFADDRCRIEDIELSIDLRRSRDRLPQTLRRIVESVGETGSVAHARRQSPMSTAGFYRAVSDLRLRLSADGLAPPRGVGRFAASVGRR